jgi:polyhydroxyalkanoate synthesis regulator phasin
MLDAVKNYINLASGVTEVTRQRAIAAAKALQASGETTAEQVQNLADELIVSSRNNRDAMLALVRYEVDRALNRLGLATADEVASLQRRVTSLEGTLAKGPTPTKAPGRKAAATRTARKSAPAKSTAAKSAPAKSTTTTSTATKTAAAKSPAKSAAAKATASKSTATKSAATKSTAQKAPAKKSASAGPSSSS